MKLKNAEMKNAALEELDSQYAQNKKNLWANLTSEINGYTEQTSDIAQKFGDLMLKNVHRNRPRISKAGRKIRKKAK